MHRLGITIFQYLDDWLMVHPDRQVLQDQLRQLLSLVNSLGFLVNLEKSDLCPSKCFVYLGVKFDLQLEHLWTSQERLNRHHKALVDHHVLRAGLIALWLHLLSIMASCIGIVPWARLHIRPIQLFMMSQ